MNARTSPIRVRWLQYFLPPDNQNSVRKNSIYRKLVIVLIIFLSAIVFILVGVFIYIFYGSNISNDPAAWGQFGEYFGMTINLAGTIAVFYLSYLVYQGQKERDQWERKILEINDTPILIFTADNNVYDKCINVGKGCALNVVIGKIAFNKRQTIIKAYSIPPNCYLQVQWENDAHMLYAYYESVEGRKYIVKCIDDVNKVLLDGEMSFEGHIEEKTANWLLKGAQRHAGISLRMIKG